MSTESGGLGMGGFFRAVVAWQRTHGRQGLPWQGTTDPYRVWLSEIMLQQTQVAVVRVYYARFLQRFPDVESLALARIEEVMALWSGLGYYSRARHLHRCAGLVLAQWGGRFPRTAAELQRLPGIGPSTAAAIAAFCHGERVSILDGNVQRVLSRLLAFGDDLAQAANMRRLWQMAQALLPDDASHAGMAAYTQGLMDLGATVCKPSQPACATCPASFLCLAFQQQQVGAFPVKTRKLQRRAQSWWLLVLRRPDGACWLQPRPDTGIWAGLHGFAVLASAQEAALPPVDHPLAGPLWHDPLRHSLTHRELLLHPVEWQVQHAPPQQTGCWVARRQDLSMGLPAPLRTWLEARLPA